MRFLRSLMRLTLLGALMMCIVLTAASAAGTENFTFALNSAGDGYTVTGYSGSDSAVTVPDWYMGKPVTAIGEGAFQGNTAIKSVSLPSSVTRIGASSFKGCTGLTAISSYTAAAPSVRVPGDADDNGTVNISDALCVLRYGAGETAQINSSNADVNADGAVDIQDALLLLQVSAGWGVKLQ